MQEVAHSLESNTDKPTRMIVKIDIEKAFDTIEWTTILTALQRFHFPKLWISWIIDKKYSVMLEHLPKLYWAKTKPPQIQNLLPFLV